MSTNLNCQFIEPTQNEWYYVLEDWGAPNNAWDWREYSTATGPFRSKDLARNYLTTHEANPGASSTIAATEFTMDSVYADLIKRARRPAR